MARFPRSTEIQTLIFDKKVFTRAQAKNWARAHDFDGDVDETGSSYRIRQLNPRKLTEGTFRTIKLTEGVKAVVGMAKRYNPSTWIVVDDDGRKIAGPFSGEDEAYEWTLERDEYGQRGGHVVLRDVPSPRRLAVGDFVRTRMGRDGYVASVRGESVTFIPLESDGQEDDGAGRAEKHRLRHLRLIEDEERQTELYDTLVRLACNDEVVDVRGRPMTIRFA